MAPIGHSTAENAASAGNGVDAAGHAGRDGADGAVRARADEAAAGGQPPPAAGAHPPQSGSFEQGEGGHAGAQAGDNQPSANWGGGGQPGPEYLQAAGWPVDVAAATGWPTMPTRTAPMDRPVAASWTPGS